MFDSKKKSKKKKPKIISEKIMEDFELYQKGECLEDPEVISRRQEVHSAWSRLQLLVEEREALIRKAINYHKTIAEVNEVLDGLENEWMKSGNDDYIKGNHLRIECPHILFSELQSEALANEIEKHASKRKLILQATSLGKYTRHVIYPVSIE